MMPLLQRSAKEIHGHFDRNQHGPSGRNAAGRNLSETGSRQIMRSGLG
jgi:hypothetical protein